MRSVIEIGHPEVLIRHWEPTDARSLADYANNRKIWRNVRDVFPHPYTLKHAEKWLRDFSHHDFFYALATAGEAIGGIGLHPLQDVYRLSAEVGFWLGEPFWNQGIMTRALTALADTAFREYPFARLSAEAFSWNPASARVLEKAGFVREGVLRNAVYKDGQIIDCLLYGKLRP